MTPRILLVLTLSLLPAVIAAQPAIYESKDKGVTTFSDQPSPGGRPMDLPLVNVIPGPGVAPPQAPASTPQAAATPYSQLSVVSPASGGTVWTNTGDFDLQLQVRPALQTRRGDAFRVKIDGKTLARTFSGPAISIAESDWARSEATDNVLHSLQVSIVDQGGAVLMESAPVSFYLRRHTLAPAKAPRAR